MSARIYDSPFTTFAVGDRVVFVSDCRTALGRSGTVTAVTDDGYEVAWDGHSSGYSRKHYPAMNLIKEGEIE